MTQLLIDLIRQEAGHNIYRPQRSCGQGDVFTRVCNSVHREGVCLSSCWDTTPEQTPTPLEQTPPPEQTPQNTPPLGADTPPGADPPGSRHPLRNRHPPEQTHPPGADTPPRADTPPGTDTPPPESRLQHTVNERPVRILLECILVQTVIAKLVLSVNKKPENLYNLKTRSRRTTIKMTTTIYCNSCMATNVFLSSVCIIRIGLELILTATAITTKLSLLSRSNEPLQSDSVGMREHALSAWRGKVEEKCPEKITDKWPKCITKHQITHSRLFWREWLKRSIWPNLLIYFSPGRHLGNVNFPPGARRLKCHAALQ